MKYDFKSEKNPILNPLVKVVQQVNMDYEELAINPYSILSSFPIMKDARIRDYWIEDTVNTASIVIKKRIPIVGKFKKTSRQNTSSEKMGFTFEEKSYSLAREEISLEVTERELMQDDPASILERANVSIGGVTGRPETLIQGSGLAVGLADRIVEKVINGDDNSREVGLKNIEKEDGVFSYGCTVGDLDDNATADFMKKLVSEIMANWQAQNPNVMQSPDEIFIDAKFQTIIDTTIMNDYHLIPAFEYYLGIYAGRKNRVVVGTDGKRTIEWLDQKDITIKYIQGFGDRILVTKKRSNFGDIPTIGLLIGNKGMNFRERGYVDMPLDFKNPISENKGIFTPYIIDNVGRKVTTPLCMWWGGIIVMRPEFVQCMYINGNAKHAKYKSIYKPEVKNVTVTQQD